MNHVKEQNVLDYQPNCELWINFVDEAIDDTGVTNGKYDGGKYFN